MTEQTNDNLPLRRLARVINGGTPGPAAENWGGPVAWATPVDLGRVDGGHISSTERTISFTGLATGSTLLPAGSVLLSSRAPIGYAAVTTKPMALNQGCKGLIPLPGVDARFLRYSLQSRLDDLQSRGRGSTFLEVNASEVASTAVPSTGELRQLQIADYLDHETAEIDALLAGLQDMLRLADEKFESLLHSILSSSDYNIPLRRIARLSTGATPSQQSANPLSSGIPWIKPGDLARIRRSTRTRNFVDGESATSMSVIPAGSILIVGIGASIGKVGYADFMTTTNQQITAAIPRPGCDPIFLYYAISGSIAWIRGNANGTTLPIINNTVLGGLPVAGFSIQDQVAIGKQLDHAAEGVEQARVELELAAELAKERRAALISAAVTGQIDVTARHKPAVEQLQDELEGK